jgi:hypothetical protein
MQKKTISLSSVKLDTLSPEGESMEFINRMPEMAGD